MRMTNHARALMIKRTLGVRVAAGYPRNRGYSLEYTLWFLLGAEARDRPSGCLPHYLTR